MSISPLSSAVSGGLFANQQNLMQQNFQALAQALESGNSQSAQQAFTTLAQTMPKPSTAVRQNNPLHQGLSDIGNALKSGDMSAARTAMQALQQNIQAPRRKDPVQQPSTGSSTSTSSTTSSNVSTSDASASDTSAPSVVTGPVRAFGLVA
jgi:DNA-binding FadR family transcriptional regulator